MLKVVRMPETERRTYYQKHIDSMQQIAALRTQKKQTSKVKNTGMGFSTPDVAPGKGGFLKLTQNDIKKELRDRKSVV